MGTKKDPGPFNCYANAEDDEPIFVLLGRDKVAPYIVRHWVRRRLDEGLNQPEDKQIRLANSCASEMFEYAKVWEQKKKRKKLVRELVSVISQYTPDGERPVSDDTLGEYLAGCLESYPGAIARREGHESKMKFTPVARIEEPQLFTAPVAKEAIGRVLNNNRPLTLKIYSEEGMLLVDTKVPGCDLEPGGIIRLRAPEPATPKPIPQVQQVAVPIGELSVKDWFRFSPKQTDASLQLTGVYLAGVYMVKEKAGRAVGFTDRLGLPYWTDAETLVISCPAPEESVPEKEKTDAS